MNGGTTPIEYRRLRAPRDNRGLLVEPSWDEIVSLVERNLRERNLDAQAEADYDVQGRSLGTLREQARRELLDGARRWVGEYHHPPANIADDLDKPIFLAGHQPELFHPGVWVKNFALFALAREHDAVAVNLLIDGDVAKDLSVRVPGGSVEDPSVEAIALDGPGPKVPYEMRSIVDRRRFAQFGRRAAERIAPFVGGPLIETYWPLVERRMRQTDNLGACLAQARHQMETAWGLGTLEIPLSRVCDSDPFRWFVAHLLARLPHFSTVHNEALRDYRRAHRTRSAAHPVPDLAREGDWLEAPLWVFSTDNPRRRPLFARRHGEGIELGDREGFRVELPLSEAADATRAVERLRGLREEGIRIRPRALITTLWARLVLGDLFLHGIGGAKYDLVTDALIERLFGRRPPGFAVLSATLHLPVERPVVDLLPPNAFAQELRQLEYHPERHIDAANGTDAANDGALAALLAEKDHWVRVPATREIARRRCRAIRRVNRALQPWVERQRRELTQWREQSAKAQRADDLLRRRDYAFCLYPEETIRGFFRNLLPKPS